MMPKAGDRNALVGGGDRGDRCDEAEGRAQIARQHVPVDQQEQCGGHSREEQGGGRVEARQNRHQEGGTEHGDDVLCADFRRCAAQVRRSSGSTTSPGRQRLAVAMQSAMWKIVGHTIDSPQLSLARHGISTTVPHVTRHSNGSRTHLVHVSHPGNAICRQYGASRWRIDGLHHIHQIAVGQIPGA